MAVTVSSKTLEATTLVIQSDLDVIVKSSRDEVFVFAENMRTGKPWPGARLLISNGRQVFAEAATGEDGVFQKSYKELKDAGDVRVFAVAEGHVASNLVGLQGVGVAQGLARQGLHLHRSAGLSRRPDRARSRLPPPCRRRRLHDREGQEIHARGLRPAQPAAVAENGQARRVRQFPRRLRPAGGQPPGPVPRAGPRRRRAKLPGRLPGPANIAWSRCG